MFEELNEGGSIGSREDVEEAYARLHVGLNVYEYRSEFIAVNPDRKGLTGGTRYVFVPWELTQFASGMVTLYRSGDISDSRILNYQPGQGKVQIDTLYKNVRAFTTGSTISGYHSDEDLDNPVTVHRGFGEVPIRWLKKVGYSAQDLQVMNVAGIAYEEQVRPKITTYDNRRRKYEENGGGPLISDFYEGTPDFPYEGFTGSRNSYNRPQALSAGLIDQARGFPS